MTIQISKMLPDKVNTSDKINTSPLADNSQIKYHPKRVADVQQYETFIYFRYS